MLPLSEFPRVPIAHRPTPLESMPNLTHLLEGPELFVKRDDCTGLATGGNKARQMEFYFGEAIEQEATAILVTGAVQSNFVRSVAAAAAKFGLRCEVQLEDRVPGMGASYGTSGNVLLDRLFGARLHYYPVGEDEGGADRALDELAARLRNEGERPYVIHLSEDYPPPRRPWIRRRGRRAPRATRDDGNTASHDRGGQRERSHASRLTGGAPSPGAR